MAAYIIVLSLVAIAFGYQLRFAEATLHMGRALSGTSAGRGVQDAITPPASSYLAFSVYGAMVLVLAFAFYQYGVPWGLGALVAFYLLVGVSRVLLLPKPDSSHFRTIVIGSMIRRHADYIKRGDNLRAAAMADLLQLAGMPVNDLMQRLTGEGSSR